MGIQTNPPIEAGLADNAAEKARESVARARRTSEMAYEAAIKARESLARSAQATKELAQDAKRKARGAQIAALKTKTKAKLAARMIKEAKAAESRAINHNRMITRKNMRTKPVIDVTAGQAEADLAQGLDIGSEERFYEEGLSIKEEPISEAEIARNTIQTGTAANESNQAKWLSSELFEGRAEILLQSVNIQQVYDLSDILNSVQNLRVEFISGSEDGGNRIAILAEQPIPLIDILGQIPLVGEVTQLGSKEIQLSLKKQ